MRVFLQGMFWVPASQVLGRAAGLRLLPPERGSDHSGRAGLPGWYGDTVMLDHSGRAGLPGWYGDTVMLVQRPCRSTRLVR